MRPQQCFSSVPLPVPPRPPCLLPCLRLEQIRGTGRCDHNNAFPPCLSASLLVLRVPYLASALSRSQVVRTTRSEVCSDPMLHRIAYFPLSIVCVSSAFPVAFTRASSSRLSASTLGSSAAIPFGR